MGTAQLEYAPEITSLSEIKKTISELGYGVSERVEGKAAQDRERETRERDIDVNA